MSPAAQGGPEAAEPGAGRERPAGPDRLLGARIPVPASRAFTAWFRLGWLGTNSQPLGPGPPFSGVGGLGRPSEEAAGRPSPP